MLLLQFRLQTNYLRLEIYFQTLNVRVESEEAKYSFDSAFAALGGSLSLYLGIAIIMCFELLELGYEIVVAVMWSQGKPISRA